MAILMANLPQIIVASQPIDCVENQLHRLCSGIIVEEIKPVRLFDTQYQAEMVKTDLEEGVFLDYRIK